MMFTNTTRGIRVWFHVVSSDGTPRADLMDGDFTARVVNSSDTALYSASVTQSLQVSGLYRFDVPAAFLTGVNGGVGDYAVSVLVNTFLGPSSGSNIRTTFSRMMQVSTELFDTLSGSIWNAPAAQFSTSGTMGHHENKIDIMSGSIDRIRGIELGRWQISGSQQIFYDEAGTEIERFDLFRSDGAPFFHDGDSVVERIPV